MSLPAVPPQLKAVSHYMKTAVEHDKRDPVIAYWCRLYSLQKAMGIDTKRECKAFLICMMEYMEAAKKQAKENDAIAEAISSEEIGSAHVENYALEIFRFADDSDRNGRFDKNVIKSFYTAGLLMDVMEVFKEGVSPELQEKRKYAKMKALYLNNCMKSGETPIPGPVSFGDEEGGAPPPVGFPTPPAAPPPANYGPPAGYDSAPPRPDAFPPPPQQPAGYGSAPSHLAPSPVAPSQAPPSTPTNWTPAAGAVSLTSDQIQKAQKYTKYAGSALQYEDINTAISNLEKALTLLRTGKDT